MKDIYCPLGAAKRRSGHFMDGVDEQPLDADQAVDTALDLLAAELLIEQAAVKESHLALRVVGLDEPTVIEALGLYLVALLAGVVGSDLRLSTALLGETPDDREELAAEVKEMLNGNATTAAEVATYKANVRNPWIAEGLAHALLAVRQRADTLCAPGSVVAMVMPHHRTTQQGLDLFAIFDIAGLPGVAIGEAKATKNDGSARLTEAIGFFKKVSDGDRDTEIRMQVALLRPVLPDELQANLSKGFWHVRGCFLPLIAHGDDFDITAVRPALTAIARAVDDKRVLHCRPDDYDSFFDAVAQAMETAVGKVYPV